MGVRTKQQTDFDGFAAYARNMHKDYVITEDPFGFYWDLSPPPQIALATVVNQKIVANNFWAKCTIARNDEPIMPPKKKKGNFYGSLQQARSINSPHNTMNLEAIAANDSFYGQFALSQNEWTAVCKAQNAFSQGVIVGTNAFTITAKILAANPEVPTVCYTAATGDVNVSPDRRCHLYVIDWQQ